MINKAFIDELKETTKPAYSGQRTAYSVQRTADSVQRTADSSPKDYLFPGAQVPRKSGINLEFLESLKTGEHEDVQKNKAEVRRQRTEAPAATERGQNRGQRIPIEVPPVPALPQVQADKFKSPYMTAPIDPSEPVGFARKGYEPKRIPLKQDITQAVKETPENIWIGTIGMGASTLEAIKRRAMQLSGGGILPDEAVKQQFEAVKPQQITPSLKQPLPGAVTSETFGLVTRLPDIGAKILRAKQQKRIEKQDKVTINTSPITRLSRSVMQSGVPSMGVAVGLSVLTGSPAVGLAVLGETEGGAAFEEQLQAGASIRKANIIGDLSEAAEIGGEMLVLPKIVKGLTKGIPLQQALTLIAENATQEGVTGFNQKFLEVFGKETSKGTSIKDAAKYAFAEGVLAIPENAFVGGATAGLADIAAAGTSRILGEKKVTPKYKKPTFEGMDVQPLIQELRKEAAATRKQRAEDRRIADERQEKDVADMEAELGEIQRGATETKKAAIRGVLKPKGETITSIPGSITDPRLLQALPQQDILTREGTGSRKAAAKLETTKTKDISQDEYFDYTYKDRLSELEEPTADERLELYYKHTENTINGIERELKKRGDVAKTYWERGSAASSYLTIENKDEDIGTLTIRLSDHPDVYAGGDIELNAESSAKENLDVALWSVEQEWGKSSEIPGAQAPATAIKGEVYYHGGPKGIKKLKAGYGNLGEGVYLTKSPRSARLYAAGWAGGVHPAEYAETGPENIYQVKITSEKPLKKLDYTEPPFGEEEIAKWKSEGYAGIETPDETIIFDAKDVEIVGTETAATPVPAAPQVQAAGIPVAQPRLAEEKPAEPTRPRVSREAGRRAQTTPSITSGQRTAFREEAAREGPIPGAQVKGKLDIAKIQEAIEGGGEKALLSAQKSAKKANKTYYVRQVPGAQVGNRWRMSVSEPAKGDYYSILPTGEILFGKTLPEIKKPGKKGTKLTSGWDPGVDQFIAEDVKPAVVKAKEAASYVKEIARAVPRMFMSVLEPAKATEQKAGREAYTATIKAIHRPEVKALEFEETRLKQIDSNIEELRKWFGNFTNEQQRDFLIANAGKPGSIEAEMIQDAALSRLPNELKNRKIVSTIREISESNFKYLKQVAGNNIGWVQDYFYGIYKNPDLVNKFIKYWKTTKRFTKQKILPSLADAINYGVEPRYDNYIDNLKAEYMGIARLEAMKWLKDDLMRTGKGVYIDDMMEAPKDWQSVKDPVFNDVSVKPELADLINKLISTNKISQNPVLNAIRKVNNFLRIVKFTGGIFHLRVIAKQAIADSGYLGFLRGKKTATRGFTLATKNKWKEIQRSPEYRKLLELGFGHRYSVEEQAHQTFKKFVDSINSGNFLGATLRAVKIPLTINLKFSDWMFNQYIPMVKTMKVMDDIAELEKKTGRQATDWETINIIKETQNFYGEMNERLFGRSGTATSVLRFFFLAPGFAEGNYRTILKSLTQWGQKGGWRAGLSRANIVNSALLTGILSTIGTLILKGRPPEEPKSLEDIRDLFKIDTGKKDSRGRKVMIDLMDYDRDYWNIYFNTLRGRPDKAVYESLRRLGGMKAPLFEIALDFAKMATGQAMYDWKGDRVTEITDSSLEKLMKIATHELKKIEPIPMSVYQQVRKKETEKIISFVEAVSGYRPTTSEKDKRESEIMRRCWSLKGQQEEMYQSLATIDKPREAVKWYNNKVADVLNSKLVPQNMRDEWLPKLTIDLERFLQNKAHTASLTETTKDRKEQVERAIKILKNFKITTQGAEQLLEDYYSREKEKPAVISPLERDRVIGRALKRKRLKERME